jgi:hypothetical protein
MPYAGAERDESLADRVRPPPLRNNVGHGEPGERTRALSCRRASPRDRRHAPLWEEPNLLQRESISSDPTLTSDRHIT